MSASADAISTPAAAEEPPRMSLMLGALGIVFGDIGTSPIYAFRESLKSAGGTTADDTILGVLSLIFWAVTAVVGIKYVVFVMRADNQGEGGTVALLSLALSAAGKFENVVLVLGLAGASLFFGDAMITPAISVLSAVEGINIITPALEPYVIPIAVMILIGLFMIQSHGSGHVGRLFGPVMLLWFLLLGLVGIVHVARNSAVLWALDPRYAVTFLVHGPGWMSFAVLGSVFLALTGGEALYADMGHFGRHAIRLDWFIVVMPALILNYFGQGALVLEQPAATSKSVLLSVPGLVACACRRVDNRCHNHCQSSRAFRRLCSCAASDSAWGAAASGRPPDFRRAGRTSVRSADQLAACGVRTRTSGWLPQLRRARQRLWHRGCGRHARHDRSNHNCSLGGLAVATPPRSCCGFRFLGARHHFLFGQSAQNSRRWLVSTCGRVGLAHSHVILATRSAGCTRAS